MFGCIGKKTGHRRVALAAGRAVVLASVVTGCSSVPESMNPANWFSGSPEPELATPRGTPAETAEAEKPKAPTEGLVADHSRAKYAQPVRREATPTKPLARRQPAAAEPQTAATPEPKPAPAPVVGQPEASAAPSAPTGPAETVAQAETPRVVPGQHQPAARDTGPAVPPASVEMTPPARPDIPETVAGVPGVPRLVKQHYEKRLAESSQTVVRPDIVDTSGRAVARDDEPIHLVPPSRHKGRGGKGMAAPAPALSGPAASFEVAALTFRDGSSDLTSTDRANLAEVARVYRQQGGVVRVVGMAPVMGYSADPMAAYDASMKRAQAVARELTRRGVPGHKIMVGADPSSPGFDNGAGARVFLDIL